MLLFTSMRQRIREIVCEHLRRPCTSCSPCTSCTPRGSSLHAPRVTQARKVTIVLLSVPIVDHICCMHAPLLQRFCSAKADHLVSDLLDRMSQIPIATRLRVLFSSFFLSFSFCFVCLFVLFLFLFLVSASSCSLQLNSTLKVGATSTFTTGRWIAVTFT